MTPASAKKSVRAARRKGQVAGWSRSRSAREPPEPLDATTPGAALAAAWDRTGRSGWARTLSGLTTRLRDPGDGSPPLRRRISRSSTGASPSRGAERTSNDGADLVLTDGAGTALLALVVDGRRDETVQAAVDALLFARENGAALAMLRPSGLAPLPPVEATARVAIVAEGYSERCLEALGLFPAGELWILEARRFEAEAGTRHVLVSLTPPPPMADRGERDRLAFLSRVPESLRIAAENLLRRLERLERGARATFAEGRATVRSGAREIEHTRGGGRGLEAMAVIHRPGRSAPRPTPRHSWTMSSRGARRATRFLQEGVFRGCPPEGASAKGLC